ncbi:hypothetical protein SESBI_00509 [Sesbania bispinosa]|nr:hypothetical protein SESBI_00509 [Sesbania bispinosa]
MQQEEDVGNIVEGEHVMPHVDASFMEDLMMNIGLVSSGNCAEENQNALPHAASFMGNHMMNMSNVSTKNFAEGVIPHVVGLMRNPMNMGNDMMARSSQFPPPSMIQPSFVPLDQPPYKTDIDMVVSNQQSVQPSMMQPPFMSLDQLPYNCHPK